MERLTPFEGKLSPCTCGKQPCHLHKLGPNTHAVECCPCAVRTAFHPTVQQAVGEWEKNRNPEVIL